ncbi:cullin-5-like isoform X2 [Xenia sp. Carnegie-2017]|nr:cullin-5-like isoform X2 [Xenia sp. Carnegie-2017]
MKENDDSVLLKTYVMEWTKFFAQCPYISKPFKSLESHSAQNNSGKADAVKVTESVSVKKLMLDTWNEIIFSNINHKLQSSAMKLVYEERIGESFDPQLVIGVRESYVNLCYNEADKLRIYCDNFEKAYLEATRHFYISIASQYLDDNGVEKYMDYAHSKIIEEEERALRYLETSKECNSCHLLSEVCVKSLVSDVKVSILEDCPGFIAANQTDKLLKMFHLVDRVANGVEPMITHLEDHVIATGLMEMMDAAATITTDSEKYVERLLMLYRRYSVLVKEAFDDDPRFLTARDKSFKKVINDTTIFNLDLSTNNKSSSKTAPESKCPELLANFCDMLLRKSVFSKKLTSDEIEAKLKEVLLVLKYVDNKDVFMRYHKAHLTRRLILDCSTDSDLEENMVEWLRDVGMPADYINKLARMFQDIKVSEDLNQEFKDINKMRSTMTDNISIKILNAGAWARSSERVAVSLPPTLEDLIPEVEEFYRGKHSGRKLQWIHLMSNGVLTFVSELGKYDIEVTTFQMAVLFAWNERRNDKLSFHDLRLATELPESELRRTLWSLIAFPKLKRQILLCEPAVQSSKELHENSSFCVNHNFAIIKSGKVQKRGKVNFIGRLQLSTEKHREEDNEAIVALRILRIQEGIVRIMKMRKTISNAQLHTELVEILKNMFIPQKKMIKEQIELLIDHKYMKRDENNINKFIYLA